MFRYECHICHGLCDAGELENGVCFNCRSEALSRQEDRQLQIRKELNQTIKARYAVQTDGQLCFTRATP